MLRTSVRPDKKIMPANVLILRARRRIGLIAVACAIF
jgi:hypothetical protein